ncbi:MAG TPA: hypothetical protein VGP41_13205 [Candidatus Lustribacter sp.]|jgi:hypothetical protein|nr:hypothetical protein [Candidatus Lustribacter sp.]
MSTDAAAGAPLVPGYAGHADVLARRLSDQQVRAWVGEMLAELEERIPIDAVRDRFEEVLLHCEFGNQHVIKAIEDNRFAEPDKVQLVEDVDRRLIEVANRGRTIEPEGLSGLLDDLDRAFNERSAAIEAQLKRS